MQKESVLIYTTNMHFLSNYFHGFKISVKFCIFLILILTNFFMNIIWHLFAGESHKVVKTTGNLVHTSVSGSVRNQVHFLQKKVNASFFCFSSLPYFRYLHGRTVKRRLSRFNTNHLSSSYPPPPFSVHSRCGLRQKAHNSQRALFCSVFFSV
jgi:hypothetical protein